MIHLPVILELIIEKYALFPGDSDQKRLDWRFHDGVTLIAGINGLGKTTLLTILLRAITGPFDLTSSGLPDTLGTTLPEHPVPLNASSLAFFAQRVADRADDAKVTLLLAFGHRQVVIRRRLSNLTLSEFSVIDPSRQFEPQGTAEQNYQVVLCELFGLSSFIDVLLVCHHLIFFAENRPGALWDKNAQRQLLRALFYDNELSRAVTEAERDVSSKDSLARNLSARAFSIDRQLKDQRKRESTVPELEAQLAVEQSLLDAELHRQAELDELLAHLDERRRDARLESEKAKLLREQADGLLEQQKYQLLSQKFPNASETARFILAQLLSGDQCLLCATHLTDVRKSAETLLSFDKCPVCTAELGNGDSLSVPTTRLVRLNRQRADQALIEEQSTARVLQDLSREYDDTVSAMNKINNDIARRRSLTTKLIDRLPQASSSTRELEASFDLTRRDQLRAEGSRAEALARLEGLLELGNGVILSRSQQFSQNFSRFVQDLLSETAILSQTSNLPRYTQARADSAITVPEFVAEMSSATRPGLSRRDRPADVSESQRELIDLAFRLALINSIGTDVPASLIIETPEASLDGLAMERVGMALRKFSEQPHMRLLLTSNLTNAGLITALFGGPVARVDEMRERLNRTMNLLRLAAPNEALLRDGDAYEALLQSAIAGRSLP